mmetsp:Transcript_10503/g.29687  ORF Transcript_10503/g.29687 Transcript_10503/m.29687 type:complete len:227 (+) Transcript_10503:424-1104(+)
MWDRRRLGKVSWTTCRKVSKRWGICSSPHEGGRAAPAAPGKSASKETQRNLAEKEAQGQEQHKVSVPLDRQEFCRFDDILVRVVLQNEPAQLGRAGEAQEDDGGGPGHHPGDEACRVNAVHERHDGHDGPGDRFGSKPHARRHLPGPAVGVDLVVVAIEEYVGRREPKEHGRPQGHALASKSRELCPRLQEVEGVGREGSKSEEAEDLADSLVTQSKGRALVDVTY